MTAEQKMETMQKDIHDIKTTVAEMYNALIGSKLSNDGGIIRRVADLENENMLLKQDVESMKKSGMKNDLYLKLLWWVLGLITAAIIMYLFQKVFK